MGFHFHTDRILDLLLSTVLVVLPCGLTSWQLSLSAHRSRYVTGVFDTTFCAPLDLTPNNQALS
jgi:hypothetical protein